MNIEHLGENSHRILNICFNSQVKLGNRFSQISTDIWFFVAFTILIIRVHPCPPQKKANSYTIKLFIKFTLPVLTHI